MLFRSPNPPHKIYLEWLPVTDTDDKGEPGQIKHYHIYRQEGVDIVDVAGLTPLADVAATVWHEDTDITENTTYYYAVTARDIANHPDAGGNEGGFANTVNVTTDTQAPIFDSTYTPEEDYWCPSQGNGTTYTVKNNGIQNKYANGDTIDIEINLSESGLSVNGLFSEVDNYGISTTVIDNGNGTYRITHYLDPNNTIPNNYPNCGERGYEITIQADDSYFNGPTYDTTFDLQLDNVPPKAP